MSNKKWLCLFTACGLFLAAQASNAQERFRVFQEGSGLSLGTGFNYSTGTYGTPDTTTITSVPFIAQYEKKDWLFRLVVPFVEVSGNGNVLPDIGRVDNSNSRGRGRSPGDTTGSASGLGDIVVSATANLKYDPVSQWGIDATGRIKLGTADRDKGLGTGENDYGAQVDVYKNLDEKLTIYTGLGYTIFGSSDFIHLDDVFNFTAGGTFKLDSMRSVGLQYDTREKVSSSSSSLSELSFFYSQKFDRDWKMQAYIMKGFADGSPDWGTGVVVMRSF